MEVGTGMAWGEQQVSLAGGQWSIGGSWGVCVGVIRPDNSNKVTGQGLGIQTEVLDLM